MMLSRMFLAELQKLKRSTITWALGAVYCLAPLMMGLMMSVLKNPELGRRMGLLTTKAQLTIGSADWSTYLMMTSYLFAGGMIVLAIADAFLFGREYVEGTAKNMLTLPIGRGTIVAAKLAVSAVWYLCMAVVVYAEALLVGLLVGLPGFSAQLLFSDTVQMAKVVLMVFLASSVSGWIAVLSRGYLAPVGFGILLLLIGDLFAHTGWGVWVPWSIILLSAQAGQPEAAIPGVASLVVMLVLFFAAGLATYLTMDRSDNSQ